MEGVEYSNGGADGGEVWGGVSPSQWVWGGAVYPPPKNFGMFSFEMVHFDAFWSTS